MKNPFDKSYSKSQAVNKEMLTIHRVIAFPHTNLDIRLRILYHQTNFSLSEFIWELDDDEC